MNYTEEENKAMPWWRCLSGKKQGDIFVKYKDKFPYSSYYFLSKPEIISIFIAELSENSLLLEQLTPEEQLKIMFNSIPPAPPVLYTISWA